jgi:polysaccharide biosynthesis/export protein
MARCHQFAAISSSVEICDLATHKLKIIDLLPMEGNMCSVHITWFTRSTGSSLSKSAPSFDIEFNAFSTSRWRTKCCFLLAGLLTITLSGCAVTGSCPAPGNCCRSAACSPGKYGGKQRGNDKRSACQIAAACNVPRELSKTSLPSYQIEIPDILLIEAVHHLRPTHAPIHAGEPLFVQVNRTIPVSQQEPSVARQFKQINSAYVIGTDGYLNLGPEYGKVLVAEQTLEEIQRRVEAHLQRILTNPQVLVTLPNPQNEQIIAGQHLVRMDGTVGLGIYGNVYVNGMTRDQARSAVERHLSDHIHNPRVSLDVLAYNSKKYYVVVDGGGAGEQVVPLPSTGNETVLDAIASIQGLPSVASKADIWVARPAPGCSSDQILPVKWNAIVQGAQTETNYQVMPGDRIYVKADKLIALDTAVAKLTAPLERVLGFTLLGNGTVQTLRAGQAAFVQGGN